MPRLQHKVNVDNAKTGKPSSNSIINDHTTVLSYHTSHEQKLSHGYRMFFQLPRPLCSFLAASATDTVMERRSRSRALAPAPAAPASIPGRPSMSTEHLREIVMFGWKIWRKSWKSKGNSWHVGMIFVLELGIMRYGIAIVFLSEFQAQHVIVFCKENLWIICSFPIRRKLVCLNIQAQQ